MLLLSGALVSGPYALITTAVSADLVSACVSAQSQGPDAGRAARLFHPGQQRSLSKTVRLYKHLFLKMTSIYAV